MKINLNIIKILFLWLGLNLSTQAYWTDVCQVSGCTGCAIIQYKIKLAESQIDKRHKKLEKRIKKKYQKDILDDNIAIIDTIQEGITKSVARIAAMEHQANIDTRELNFILQQNKKLYTLPAGNL